MLSDAQLEEMRRVVGAAQVHAGPAQLIAYSLDGTFAQDPPDVAVTPATTDEVVALMRIAARDGLPVVPRGAGTSLAGGAPLFSVTRYRPLARVFSFTADRINGRVVDTAASSASRRPGPPSSSTAGGACSVR